MQFRIEESCSCGARLVYSDIVTEAYESHVAGRQAEFHKAHANCRPIEVSDTAALPQATTKREEKK